MSRFSVQEGLDRVLYWQKLQREAKVKFREKYPHVPRRKSDKKPTASSEPAYQRYQREMEKCRQTEKEEKRAQRQSRA